MEFDASNRYQNTSINHLCHCVHCHSNLQLIHQITIEHVVRTPMPMPSYFEWRCEPPYFPNMLVTILATEHISTITIQSRYSTLSVKGPFQRHFFQGRQRIGTFFEKLFFLWTFFQRTNFHGHFCRDIFSQDVFAWIHFFNERRSAFYHLHSLLVLVKLLARAKREN